MKKEVVLDTNIFVRFFIKDIKVQFQEAKKLFEEIENTKIVGRVSILVINELILILENYYELKRSLFIPKILKLLALKNIKIIEVKKNLVIKVLETLEKTKFDFTDIYLAGITNKGKIFTFDKDFEKIRI